MFWIVTKHERDNDNFLHEFPLPPLTLLNMYPYFLNLILFLREMKQIYLKIIANLDANYNFFE